MNKEDLKKLIRECVTEVKLEPTLFALIHSNRYLYFDRVLFLTHAKERQLNHLD